MSELLGSSPLVSVCLLISLNVKRRMSRHIYLSVYFSRCLLSLQTANSRGWASFNALPCCPCQMESSIKTMRCVSVFVTVFLTLPHMHLCSLLTCPVCVCVCFPHSGWGRGQGRWFPSAALQERGDQGHSGPDEVVRHLSLLQAASLLALQRLWQLCGGVYVCECVNTNVQTDRVCMFSVHRYQNLNMPQD